MKPDNRVRLRHMVDALKSAIRFTKGRRREDLDGDEMLAFALVHALQIVGEAASKVSAETRNQRPAIPWATLIGMRHRLVHAYFDVNFDILWTTAIEAAPALLAQIEPLLESDRLARRPPALSPRHRRPSGASSRRRRLPGSRRGGGRRSLLGDPLIRRTDKERFSEAPATAN